MVKITTGVGCCELVDDEEEVMEDAGLKPLLMPVDFTMELLATGSLGLFVSPVDVSVSC